MTPNDQKIGRLSFHLALKERINRIQVWLSGQVFLAIIIKTYTKHSVQKFSEWGEKVEKEEKKKKHEKGNPLKSADEICSSEVHKTQHYSCSK